MGVGRVGMRGRLILLREQGEEGFNCISNLVFQTETESKLEHETSGKRTEGVGVALFLHPRQFRDPTLGNGILVSVQRVTPLALLGVG